MTKPIIIFPSDQLRPYRVDDQYAQEAEVAEKIGFQIGTVDHDALERQDIRQALKRLDLMLSSKETTQQVLYRGWMLTEYQYSVFNNALSLRGLTLLNDPQAYVLAHHYPLAYQTLMHQMPKSWFIEEYNLKDDGYLAYALDNLPKGAVLIKDWVKSQSHYWDEACFIPNTSDIQHARKVINRFLDLQGSGLVGGVVLREYHKLVTNEEWRAIMLDGQVLGCWPKTTGQVSPPVEFVQHACSLVFSRFASVDFALKQDGNWMVVETGDGQVSEFPATCPKTHIFLSIKEAFEMDRDMIKSTEAKI